MILQNYITNLLNLVCLCLTLFRLKVNDLFDSWSGENTMASPDSLFKSQVFQQKTKIIEINICNRVSQENLLPYLSVLAIFRIM